MKVNIKSVKNVAPNKNMVKKIIAVIISIMVIIVSYVMISKAAEDTKNTVSVVRVKRTDGLQMDALITKDDVEVYNVIKTEYSSDMILAEDIENAIGMYTLYYLRQNLILYKDQVGEKKPITNEWLYELAEDEEVVTVPYNYLKCGGDILMPGDRIRIRATYELPQSQGRSTSGSTSESWYVADVNDSSVIDYQSKNSNMRTQIVFDSILIKDMLNAESHSIYEIYKEVLRLDKKKQEEVLKSKQFLKSILPRALVLAGTKEDINEYAKYANVKDGELLITILSRESSNAIIDQLPTLQSEVASWLTLDEK